MTENIATSKPSPFIETRHEMVNGFPYAQPVEYCNGKKWTDYPPGSIERKQWGEIYWNSRNYTDALAAIRADNPQWRNEAAKEKAFLKVYDFFKKGGSGTGSSVTELQNFEIELLNNDFEMMGFCELNALNPSFCILGIIKEDGVYDGLKGIHYRRWYKRGDLGVYMGFGRGNVNFYFVLSSTGKTYQVDNDVTRFEAAINGKLTPLN